MDKINFNTIVPIITAENENNINKSRKRKASETLHKELSEIKKEKAEHLSVAAATAETDDVKATKEACASKQSPKKRLEIANPQQKLKNNKLKFIYGNYNSYYGYRNKDFQDIRLDIFAKKLELFQNKELLDIGCNSGFITMEIAKRFTPKQITGIDIDRYLITQAYKSLTKQKKRLPVDNEASKQHTFPFNINFVHANYVLSDDVLLEIERERYDVILCLSITKWIHLNFGDTGLKQSFRRMFLQLRSGGKLILEAQAFDNYKRRKKITDNIFHNYKTMQFFPRHFTDYLLSPEVGFTSVELMGVPDDNCAAGFKRPIQIFSKA